MVVGIAGGVGPAVKVGDVLVPNVVIDGPSGTEFRPAELTGIASRGRLVTSDDFHVDPDELVGARSRGRDRSTWRRPRSPRCARSMVARVRRPVDQ
jgi:hypothetical protein